LFYNHSEKSTVMFSCKPFYSFLVPLMWLSCRTYKRAPKFFHYLYRILGLRNGHKVPLSLLLLFNKHQGQIRMYWDIQHQRLQNVVWMDLAAAHAEFQTTAIHIAATAVWPGCLVKVWCFHFFAYALQWLFCISSIMYYNFTFK
jgi:hypothetical protein